MICSMEMSCYSLDIGLEVISECLVFRLKACADNSTREVGSLLLSMNILFVIFS